MSLRNTLTKGLASIVLAGALIGNSNAGETSAIPKAPIYGPEKVPDNFCSRYVRFASKDLYNKEFDNVDAWNLRYHSKIVSEIKDDNIEQLAKSGKLKPGMVVGVFNPKSKYNSKKDEQNNFAKYTHVILYVGEVNFGNTKKLGFAHKYSSNTYLDSVEQIRKRGLKFREVLDSKK